jgi:hypothetical protein
MEAPDLARSLKTAATLQPSHFQTHARTQERRGHAAMILRTRADHRLARAETKNRTFMQ